MEAVAAVASLRIAAVATRRAEALLLVLVRALVRALADAAAQTQLVLVPRLNGQLVELVGGGPLPGGAGGSEVVVVVGRARRQRRGGQRVGGRETRDRVRLAHHSHLARRAEGGLAVGGGA